jgi:hypothetical protein
MENKLSIILLLFILTSNNVLSQIEDELIKYPLKAIEAYCQKDTQKLRSITRFTYDPENRLIQREEESGNGKHIRTIQYFYNKDGLIDSSKFVTNFAIKKMVYNYDEKSRLISTECNREKEKKAVTKFYYDDLNQLIKRKYTWNERSNEYEFDYDSTGRVKNYYVDNKLKMNYYYSDNLLIEKTKFNYRSLVTRYEYNDKGQIQYLLENGKIIEENLYIEEKMVGKWSNYYGIDPCHDMCCSQLYFKYLYYE